MPQPHPAAEALFRNAAAAAQERLKRHGGYNAPPKRIIVAGYRAVDVPVRDAWRGGAGFINTSPNYRPNQAKLAERRQRREVQAIMLRGRMDEPVEGAVGRGVAVSRGAAGAAEGPQGSAGRRSAIVG